MSPSPRPAKYSQMEVLLTAHLWLFVFSATFQGQGSCFQGTDSPEQRSRSKFPPFNLFIFYSLRFSPLPPSVRVRCIPRFFRDFVGRNGIKPLGGLLLPLVKNTIPGRSFHPDLPFSIRRFKVVSRTSLRNQRILLNEAISRRRWFFNRRVRRDRRVFDAKLYHAQPGVLARLVSPPLLNLGEFLPHFRFL